MTATLPLPERAEALRGHAAMTLFAAIVAGSFSLGALAAPEIDPRAINAARFALAALILGALMAAGPGFRRDWFRAPWRYLVLAAPMALFFVLMFVALRLIDPVSGAAVFTLIPLMSAGFGRLVAGQRSRRSTLAALGVGALGAIWVIFDASLARLAAFEIGRGEAIFLVGCAGHALYTPLVPRLRRGEPLLASTFGVLVGCGLIVGLSGAKAVATTDWAGLPPVVWIAIVYLAVFATAGSFFLVQFAAMRLPAGKVMAYGYLVPSLVAVCEGLSGRGWPPPEVWAGVLLTAGALAALAARRD